MKGLIGSKLVGWGLVAVVVFFIAQAAAGPKKASKSVKEPAANSQSASDSTAADGRGGGAVQSEKTSAATTLPILAYNYISTYRGDNTVLASLHVAPAKFVEQMAYLDKNNYQVVSLDTVVQALSGQKSLPKKAVAITFSDGYTDFYQNALPVLKKYGFSASVFVITNRPGDANFMDWTQLSRVATSGFEVGSQSVSNADLTRVALSRVLKEVTISKVDIQGEIGNKVDYFAYPYGYWSTAVSGLVKQAGYKAAFTLGQKDADDAYGLYAISRKTVDGRASLTTFANLLK